MHRRAQADFFKSREMLDHLVDRHPEAPAPHAWLAKCPNDHRHVRRWDPWVRSYLSEQELIGSLQFGVGAKGESVSVSTRVPIKSPSESPLLLATLVRSSAKVFGAHLDLVLGWAEMREERLLEILAQIPNIYAFWGSIIPNHTDRLRHTREVIDAAVQFAKLAKMRFKHEFACWRPADLSPQVQPFPIDNLPGDCSALCWGGTLCCVLRSPNERKAPARAKFRAKDYPDDVEFRPDDPKQELGKRKAGYYYEWKAFKEPKEAQPSVLQPMWQAAVDELKALALPFAT